MDKPRWNAAFDVHDEVSDVHIESSPLRRRQILGRSSACGAIWPSGLVDLVTNSGAVPVLQGLFSHSSFVLNGKVYVVESLLD